MIFRCSDLHACAFPRKKGTPGDGKIDEERAEKKDYMPWIMASIIFDSPISNV